jgi:hypothetical protein
MDDRLLRAVWLRLYANPLGDVAARRQGVRHVSIRVVGHGRQVALSLVPPSVRNGFASTSWSTT